MPPPSPTVASWELSSRLRERRIELGVDVATITQRLGFTRNYWSAIENERRTLTEEKLAALLDLMEYGDDERAELLGLRETARQRGWWAGYSGLFDAELQRVFGLEYGAQAIRTYENLLVPGLLQTPQYARALMEADISVRPVEVDQRVAVRLKRQERLDGPDPLHLTAVISQAALLQEIGGHEVRRAQLRHLAASLRAHPDTIELRVIPFTAPACAVFGASTFHLFDYASPRLPTLAWQETVTAGRVLDDDAQVRDVLFFLTDGLRQSLDAEASVLMVENYAEES